LSISKPEAGSVRAAIRLREERDAGIPYRARPRRGLYVAGFMPRRPGIVTYTGYRGAYGKVVEIEHGNEIANLCSHMHRYTVSVGQRVEARTQMGLLGSTGRASGSYVHYEVIVNGQPQDPEKFMEITHLVPIAEK
jgi:murein DD-endopeptidase MepM/ murein hydrolase activator NlpD